MILRTNWLNRSNCESEGGDEGSEAGRLVKNCRRRTSGFRSQFLNETSFFISDLISEKSVWMKLTTWSTLKPVTSAMAHLQGMRRGQSENQWFYERGAMQAQVLGERLPEIILKAGTKTHALSLIMSRHLSLSRYFFQRFVASGERHVQVASIESS